jgi:NADPH2:quinone reductase
MKAVYVSEFGEPDVLRLDEVPVPSIGSTEVLIRVAAASVNFADIKARRGKYHGTGNPPFIPGLDVAGTVEKIGVEVTEVKVGQRVIAFPTSGSYSEYTVADQVLTFPIPDEICFDVAAACPVVSVTTFNLLSNVAQIKPGESVLIHSAAGGIGTTAIQMAKLLGASTVIGTVSSDYKVDTAKKAGADYVINYTNEDLCKTVSEITDGKRVDVILDSIGGILFAESVKCLANFGRLVNFGNSLGEAGKIKTSDLHKTCRSVLGYSLGTHLKERPETLRKSVEEVVDYIKNDDLELMISKRFKLSEVDQAHKWIESRQSVGKVLLIP